MHVKLSIVLRGFARRLGRYGAALALALAGIFGLSGTALAQNVFFNPNGADVGTVTEQNQALTLTIGDPFFTIIDLGFTKANYQFVGWSNIGNDGTGTIDYPDGDAVYDWVGEIPDRQVYAQWRQIVTLSFNGMGGVGTMANQVSSTPGTALTVNTYTRSGYTFLGWDTAPAANTVVYNDGDTTFNFGALSTATAPDPVPFANAAQTLYAVWSLDAGYKEVTFNANGGTGTMVAQAGNSDATTLTPNQFTRAGYTFGGWALSSGGAVVYSDGNAYPFANALTGNSVELFALWVPVPVAAAPAAIPTLSEMGLIILALLMAAAAALHMRRR